MSWHSTPLSGSRMSGSLRRQVGERDRRRDQGVERGVVQQVERGGKTAAIVPARAMRRRDLADLAGDELEAAGVEDVAERDFHFVGAVPGQFQHRRLVAGEPQRGREPGRGGAGVHHQIAVAGRLRRAPRSRRRTPGQCAARAGLMSTTVTCVPGILAHSRATSRPSTPAPTTAIRSAGPGAPSHTALSAVSMLAASTARSAGSPSGSGRIFSTARLNTVWCG